MLFCGEAPPAACRLLSVLPAAHGEVAPGGAAAAACLGARMLGQAWAMGPVPSCLTFARAARTNTHTHTQNTHACSPTRRPTAAGLGWHGPLRAALPCHADSRRSARSMALMTHEASTHLAALPAPPRRPGQHPQDLDVPSRPQAPHALRRGVTFARPCLTSGGGGAMRTGCWPVRLLPRCGSPPTNFPSWPFIPLQISTVAVALVGADQEGRTGVGHR